MSNNPDLIDRSVSVGIQGSKHKWMLLIDSEDVYIYCDGQEMGVQFSTRSQAEKWIEGVESEDE